MSSAVATTWGTSTRWARRASISGSGSVASTSCPARCRTSVSLPVPAPSSRTIERPDPVIQLTASSGYDGRARS